MRQFLILLVFSAFVFAFGQAPTGLTVAENVLTTSPYTLGANLAWNSVSGATAYNVWRAPGICTGSPAWAVLAPNITTTSYTDPNLALGQYCYAVDAVVGGVESAKSTFQKIYIGDKSYWTLQYYLADCKTIIDSPYPTGGSYELHQVDSAGKDTVILSKPFVSDNVVGEVQLIDAFEYYSKYIDDNGKIWTVPMDSGANISPNPGPSLSSVSSNQGTLRLIAGSPNKVCNSYNQFTNEPATTN